MFETNYKSNAITFAFIALMFICVPHTVTCQEFGYDGSMGPAQWAEQYNTCGGKFQSPINIDILEVVDRQYDPLKLNGFNVTPISAELVNNGHTVVSKLIYKDGETPTIYGGSLGSQGIYRFSQFHFHWGDNDTVGSEDHINNISYPAELHMVFYNVKYQSFLEAVKHNGGVAVLAFFYVIQPIKNVNYVEFSFLLGEVREPNTTAFFLKPPTLENLINKEIDNYFTYTGSLTTPPCSEDVTWIEFEKPILISAEQIKPFRELLTLNGIPLKHNFRPVQPLNNRTVFKSMPMSPATFQQHKYDGSNSASDVVVRSVFYLLIYFYPLIAINVIKF